MPTLSQSYINHYRRHTELSVPIEHDGALFTLCDLRVIDHTPSSRVNITDCAHGCIKVKPIITEHTTTDPHESDANRNTDSNNNAVHSVEQGERLCLSIGSNLTVPNDSALPLHFNPSLNYLAVIGGASNSKYRGRFNEFEFQNNALNHLSWLVTASNDFYQAHALTPQDRKAYGHVFQMLIKCHCIDQLFNSALENTDAVAEIARTLLGELQNTQNLLLHARDQTHAFYIEITGHPKRCDIHIYNTGKGLVYHQRKVIINNQGKRKLKYYTRHTTQGIELNVERLSRLISNMSRIPFRLLPRIPIYKMYLLLSHWQLKSNQALDKKSFTPIQPAATYTYHLQAKQKWGDCQQKSLLAVIKHQLTPLAYIAFKKSLLERSIAVLKPPAKDEFSGPWGELLLWHRRFLYENAISRAKDKVARINAKELPILSL